MCNGDNQAGYMGSQSEAAADLQVMELVELLPLRNALVGLPGSTGLSVEQRKRLTIAVELVANPSIIFMDEPTTGTLSGFRLFSAHLPVAWVSSTWLAVAWIVVFAERPTWIVNEREILLYFHLSAAPVQHFLRESCSV